MNNMTIVGISSNESGGRIYTTLHVVRDFDNYQGQKGEAINAGGYDCSGLEVGQEIEVYYQKAIATAKGTFQPVALIRVLSE